MKWCNELFSSQSGLTFNFLYPMQQCLVVHGGEAFDTEEQYYSFLEKREVDPTKPKYKKRRDRLAHALSHERQVFLPQMPNAQNATYKAWKIWFEKHLPYLT